MKVDFGVEHSTIPWALFQNNLLAAASYLVSTTVTLGQYDQTPLVVKGECQVNEQNNECEIVATFIYSSRCLYKISAVWQTLDEFTQF